MKLPQQAEREELDRLAVYYYAWRHGGNRAVDAHREARKMLDETNIWIAEGDTSGNIIGRLLPIAVAVGMVVMALRSFLGYVHNGRWITSPSGKTTVQLPFQLALRIVRKRKWRFAEVGPVKPERIFTREEALRVLLFGDNGTTTKEG